MADWEPELELKLGWELNDGAAGCEGWLLNDGEGCWGRLNVEVGCWGRLNEEGGGREDGLEPLGEDHYAKESGIQRKICMCLHPGNPPEGVDVVEEVHEPSKYSTTLGLSPNLGC